MRSIIILSILFFATVVNAQTYLKPKYEKRTNNRVEIDKIQITKTRTIVSFTYTSEFAGHACIDQAMYIQDVKTKKKYPLVKAVGIPICPEQRVFADKGHTFKFKLIFPKVPYSVRYVNLVEDMTNGFNFINVYLKPLAH